MGTVNQQLTIKWKGESLNEQELKSLVVALKSEFTEGEWVGHEYNQCDEEWEPLITDD